MKEFVFDGAGVGIYLGFIEIRDRVPNKQVLTYANAFLFISILFFVVCLYALYKAILVDMEGDSYRLRETLRENGASIKSLTA